MDPLILLTNKIDQLLHKYETAQAENEKLKQEMGEQLQAIEHLNSRLQELEQQLEKAQTAPAKDTEATKQQLDNIISEIDQLLTTLNE